MPWRLFSYESDRFIFYFTYFNSNVDVKSNSPHKGKQNDTSIALMTQGTALNMLLWLYNKTDLTFWKGNAIEYTSVIIRFRAIEH